MRTNSFLIFVLAIVALQTHVLAQSNSKGAKSQVVVGVLKSVDASGKRFEVLQEGNFVRKLLTHDKSKVYFVGLPKEADRRPSVGLGVKASTENGGMVKSITFTPAIGKAKPLGEEKLTLSAGELFSKVDRDADGRVSYGEFSEAIYYSPKHGPDAFRNADRDGNGTFDSQEFEQALAKVSWWKLSRKTAVDWFREADKNRDSDLEIKKFSLICSSGNHIDRIFKRADGDASGSLSQQETANYIRSVTHGKKKSRGKRKRNK